MLENFRSDLDRYTVMNGDVHWLRRILFKQGIWVLMQYRFSRWVYEDFHVPCIRQILRVFCFFWQKLVEITTGVELPNRAKLGKGVFIPHANSIQIHGDVEIGEYPIISQRVSIGLGGRGENRGCPKIGDRVFIAPGAIVFGPITIGNDVAIGANAVVTKDLPDNAVAVGIPAKIINYKGSQDFIFYREKAVSSSDSSEVNSSSLSRKIL